MKLRHEIKEEAKGILKQRWGQAFVATLIYGAMLYLGTWLLMDLLVAVFRWYPGTWLMAIFVVIVLVVFEAIIFYNLIVYFIKFKRGENGNAFDEMCVKILGNFKAMWAVAWGIFSKMWYYFVIVIACVLIIVGLGMSALGGNSVLESTKQAQDVYQQGVGDFPTISETVATPSQTGGIGELVLVGITPIAILVISIFILIKGLYYVLSPYVMYDSGNTLKGREAAKKSRELMKKMRGEYLVLGLSFIGWEILAYIVGGVLFAIVAHIINWTPLLNLIAFIPMAMVLAYMQISMVIFYEELAGRGNEEVTAEIPGVNNLGDKIEASETQNNTQNETHHMNKNMTIGLSIVGVIIIAGIIIITVIFFNKVKSSADELQSSLFGTSENETSISMPGVGTISAGEDGATVTGDDGTSITVNNDWSSITGDETSITADGSGDVETSNDSTYTSGDNYLTLYQGNDFVNVDMSDSTIGVYLGDNFINVYLDSINISESDITISKSRLNNTIGIDGNYLVLNGQEVLVTGNTVANVYNAVKTILGY
ncbi:MAG: DUF975 family protein [Oscillospiraceae bacterium]|nr:DUF975 family protein [Oscillospiraceae bacterium]